MNASHRTELGRALRNGHFELDGNGGLLLPRQGLFVGGSARSNVNGQDHQLMPNTMSSEGLIDILTVYFAAGSAPTGFYLAPFAGNVAPDATLKAANFNARMTEFVAYNETARVAWTPGDIETPQADNADSLATFTINAANSTVYGFALLTNQVKQGTTGKLISCFKDPSPRTGLQVGDKLNVEYVIVAQDES